LSTFSSTYEYLIPPLANTLSVSLPAVPLVLFHLVEVARHALVQQVLAQDVKHLRQRLRVLLLEYVIGDCARDYPGLFQAKAGEQSKKSQ
jgi:hypothetical protein